MKKYLSILISVLSLVIVFSIVGVGFGAWYFNEELVLQNANIRLSSYIDFDGLSLYEFKLPYLMALEDPLSNYKESSAGIYFFDIESSRIEHSSSSTACSDVVYFSFLVDDSFSNSTEFTSSDFKTYLGIEVSDSSLTSYLDFNGYLYDSTSLGKEVELTKSILDGSTYFISSYIHLEEVITYKNKEETFNNLTNLTNFIKAFENAYFNIVISLKENS